MLTVDYINVVMLSLVTIIIVSCSIGIIIASRFQMKKNKKYTDCITLIKKKGDTLFQVKDGLNKEDINKIDKTVSVDDLMKNLYETYITFQKKVKNYDTDLDNILTGYIKEFYLNKIENFKINGYSDVIDNIELINYSILEFSKTKLKFRITINCFSYKEINNKIVSGSNLEKMEKVIILTYEKHNDSWLISNYEKIYEKKLSE